MIEKYQVAIPRFLRKQPLRGEIHRLPQSRFRRRALYSCPLVIFLLGRTAFAGPPALQVGDAAPNFKVKIVTSEPEREVGPAAYHGKILLLEFWATWCGPCAQAREGLAALHKKFKGDGFEILAVTEEEIEKVKKYALRHPVSYTLATDVQGKIQTDYHIKGIPSAVLINKEGRICWLGDPRELTEKAIEKLLQTGQAPPTSPYTRTPFVQDESEPVLVLKIARSRGKKATSTGISMGISPQAVSLGCDCKSLSTILQQSLEISRARLKTDPIVGDILYDIEFMHCPTNGRPPRMQILADALCREAGIELLHVKESREAWTATVAQANLMKVSKGAGGMGPDGKGGVQFRGVTISDLLRWIENRYNVLIEDETHLQDRYNFDCPSSKVEIEEFCRRLQSDYGLQFTESKRDVVIWNAVSRQEKKPSPHSN